MQTYSRKRPEYQAIEGVKELCRLCLEKFDEAVPIFTDDSNVCASLPMRIMICVGLQMVREECLPNMICKECYLELERYYTFRKKCVVSYQKLKSHILAVKVNMNKYVTEPIEKDGVQENRQDGPVSEKSDKDGQRVVLAYNEGEQLEIVDVVSLNGVMQVGDDIKKVAELTKSNDVIQESEEVHMPELTNTNLPTIQMTSEWDMSSLLTSLLMELGVMTRHDDRLKLMQNVKTLELEGGDGNVVTLELVEEDVQAVVDKGGTTALQEIDDADMEGANVIEVCIEPAKAESAVTGARRERSKDNSKDAGAWCKVCEKRFSSRSTLARHALVHSAERPHTCARCGRSFAQRAVLRRHELVHQERRPFACAVCGKSYTQRGALADHSRVHSRVHGRALTLHRCAHCPKVFLYSSGLSRHVKTHEGRVFTCGGCSRHFRDKSALLRHLRTANHHTA